jgi:hypothetical protein
MLRTGTAPQVIVPTNGRQEIAEDFASPGADGSGRDFDDGNHHILGSDGHYLRAFVHRGRAYLHRHAGAGASRPRVCAGTRFDVCTSVTARASGLGRLVGDDGCSTVDQPFREGVPHNIGTDCRVSIDRAGRHVEAVPLFWLNYRHPDGRFALVAVVEATALVQARMKAAVTGLDEGLDFTVGHELGEESARQIPGDMIGGCLTTAICADWNGLSRARNRRPHQSGIWSRRVSMIERGGRVMCFPFAAGVY